jgi:Nucleotide modification associated domain 2
VGEGVDRATCVITRKEGKTTMSNLYTYVMQHDAGLAPNPFWGVCTLAVCTPNHQGSRIRTGDWVAGVSDKRRGYRLIHVMEVDERIHMTDYFSDPRFADKRPMMSGTTEQRCGDNFYSQDAAGRWIQHPNRYHVGQAALEQDTRHPWVFTAKRFWYFGRDAGEVLAQYKPLFGGRGARVNHPPELVAGFRSWVEANLVEGLNAMPRDLEVRGCGVRSAAALEPLNC